jgi:hypothetical protein
VDTPHDLELERVAAAFGGGCSCLVLVDVLVPALRAQFQHRARRPLPPLRRSASDTWWPSPRVPGCCQASHSAAGAAAHLRSLSHHLRDDRGSADVLAALTDAVVRAHGGRREVPLPIDEAAAAARCVTHPLGVDTLWDAGIHPALVRAVHGAVVGAGGAPLPLDFYLGVACTRPDLGWVAATLQAAEVSDGSASAELATWLAWSATALDRAQPAARAAWLAIGLPRARLEELSRAGYAVEDLRRLDATTRRGLAGTADWLAAWVRAVGHVPVDALVSLVGDGFLPYGAPSRQAVVLLRRQLRATLRVGDADPFAATLPDLALGLALVHHGTVSAAAHALRAAAPPAAFGRPPQSHPLARLHVRPSCDQESA